MSLFVAGFFAQSFARKLIDIDYHIAMGGRAYGHARRSHLHAAGAGCSAAVFAELSEKFQPMVDALNEVSEGSVRALGPRHPAAVRDLAEDRQRPLLRQLKRLGVDPTTAGGTAFTH